MVGYTYRLCIFWDFYPMIIQTCILSLRTFGSEARRHIVARDLVADQWVSIAMRNTGEPVSPSSFVTFELYHR